MPEIRRGHGLRRDMRGSALPLFLCRGGRIHFDVAARALAPSEEAFDAPLGPRPLDRKLEPATRRSGSYLDGTHTRWFGEVSGRTTLPRLAIYLNCSTRL